MKFTEKNGVVLLSIVLFILYAIFVDYDSPEGRSDVIKIGVLMLFMYGSTSLFGLIPLWKFLSKRITIIGKTDFRVFVFLLANILAVSLLIFIATAGVWASSWLDITFNGSSIDVESFLLIGVIVRLFQYKGN